MKPVVTKSAKYTQTFEITTNEFKINIISLKTILKMLLSEVHFKKKIWKAGIELSDLGSRITNCFLYVLNQTQYLFNFFMNHK